MLEQNQVELAVPANGSRQPELSSQANPWVELLEDEWSIHLIPCLTFLKRLLTVLKDLDAIYDGNLQADRFTHHALLVESDALLQALHYHDLRFYCLEQVNQLYLAIQLKRVDLMQLYCHMVKCQLTPTLSQQLEEKFNTYGITELSHVEQLITDYQPFIRQCGDEPAMKYLQARYYWHQQGLTPAGERLRQLSLTFAKSCSAPDLSQQLERFIQGLTYLRYDLGLWRSASPWWGGQVWRRSDEQSIKVPTHIFLMLSLYYDQINYAGALPQLRWLAWRLVDIAKKAAETNLGYRFTRRARSTQALYRSFTYAALSLATLDKTPPMSLDFS